MLSHPSARTVSILVCHIDARWTADAPDGGDRTYQLHLMSDKANTLATSTVPTIPRRRATPFILAVRTDALMARCPSDAKTPGDGDAPGNEDQDTAPRTPRAIAIPGARIDIGRIVPRIASPARGARQDGCAVILPPGRSRGMTNSVCTIGRYTRGCVDENCLRAERERPTRLYRPTVVDTDVRILVEAAEHYRLPRSHLQIPTSASRHEGLNRHYWSVRRWRANHDNG